VLAKLLQDQVLFDPADTAVVGPTPHGLWFQLDLTHAAEAHSHSSGPLHLDLGLPLVKNLYVFEVLPQGPQLVFHSEHVGLHSTVIALPQHATLLTQRQFMGYFESPYPTRLSPRLVSPPTESHYAAIIATLLLISVSLVSTVLSVRSKPSDQWHSIAVMIISTLLCALLIVPITGIHHTRLDPITLGLLCAAALWLATVDISDTRTDVHALKLPTRLLIPFFVILGLGLAVLSPSANGPVRLLSISTLLAHVARMHWRFKVQTLRSSQATLPQVKVYLSVNNVIRMLGCGSLLGLSLLYAFWSIPIGPPSFVFLMSPEHWIAIHIALLGLVVSTHAYRIVVWHTLQRHQKAQKIEQPSLRDLNRGMLARLNQHIVQKPLPNSVLPVDRSPVTSMRSDDAHAHRIRLDTIGESPNTTLEKVSEYSDITLLLSEETCWDTQPFHVRKWIHQHIANWSQRAHRYGKQLIVSVRPYTPIEITADEEKLTHIMHTLLDISLCTTSRGNIVLRLDANETEMGHVVYRLTIQDTCTELPDDLATLLNTPWLKLSAKPFQPAHLHYARVLLAQRWLHSAGGSLSVTHDHMFGARYRITFNTHPQSSSATDAATLVKNSTNCNSRQLLMMTYDAEYGATMAEQANHLNHPMSLALSTKQAIRNLRHSQRVGRHFDALLIDFSRDAESLQGFVFELREIEQYCNIPIVLLTNPEQRVEYLTQLLSDVFAVVRPGYFPSLISTVNGFLFKLNPTLRSAIKSASFQL
ncbi:MAG: hypothetical protein P8144_14140, partial [Gammaproteobacteria bacterium]